MLVRGVVVEDRVDHLAGRHGTFDGVEELDEILMPVVATGWCENDGDLPGQAALVRVTS